MTISSEALIEVKNQGNIRFLPFYKRINPYYPIFVRATVLEKLIKIAENLPNMLKLQVDSGYRTPETQEALWNKRREEVEGLVYDPRQGLPPHLTGGAVDVSLTDEQGNELNLSKPFKKFYTEPKLKSDKITKYAQNLRFMLNSAMLTQGFAPNEKEYWHFSYGDQAWADYYKTDVLYDKCELPLKSRPPLLKLLILKFAKNLWKLNSHLFNVETNY